MVALRVAARDPSRVDRVAVLCTSALLGPPEHWAQRAAAVRLDGVASIAPTIVQRWFTEGRRRRDPALVAWAEAMVASTPVEGYASCCGAIERMDLRADLPRIVAPLLAIAGAQDPSTPPRTCR